MDLPAGLSDQFRLIEELDISSTRGHRYYLIEGRAGTTWRGSYFLKVTPYDELDEQVEQAIRDNTSSDHINRSVLTLHDDNSSFFVSPYRTNGSLASVMRSDPGDPAVIRQVVAQLHEALKELHAIDIVHCDLKPSNVLVIESSPGAIKTALTDFGHSTPLIAAVPRARGYTPRYAAPQVVFPNVELNGLADYWSLGMLLLEWATGEHAFAGMSRAQIYEELSAFGPNLRPVTHTELRALIAGLLRVNADERFGANDVDRWLDNEPAVISEGLLYAGEPATERPLAINGQLAFCPAGLAQVLLETGDPELAQSPEVLTWVESDLGRADIATEMRRLIEQESDSELNLLRICFYLWPGMPPVWRRQKITRERLVEHCRKALNDNEDSLSWLWSFWDSPGSIAVFEEYSGQNAAFEEVAEISDVVRRSFEVLDRSWEEIQECGAPVDARSTRRQELPQIMLAALDEEYSDDLRSRSEALFDPETLMLRADWFYSLGAGSWLDIEQLIVLSRLEPLSRLQALTVDEVIDGARIAQGDELDSVTIYGSQQNLLSGLTVKAGAEMTHFRDGGYFNPDNLRRPFQGLRENIWQPFVDSLNYLFDRVRQAIPARNAGADDDEVGNADETEQVDLVEEEPVESYYDAYILPLVPRSPGVTHSDQYTTYLIRLTWQVSSERTVDIVLFKGRWPFRRRKLKLTRLPHHGHLILHADSNSEFSLREKAGFISVRRFPSLRMRIREPDVVLARVAGIESCAENEPLDERSSALHDVRPENFIQATASSPASGFTGTTGSIRSTGIVAQEIESSSPTWVAASISDRDYRRILRQVRRSSKHNEGVIA